MKRGPDRNYRIPDCEEWTAVKEIKYIEMKDGTIFVPDIRYYRVKALKRGICVMCGTTAPYGAVLHNVTFAYDFSAIRIDSSFRNIILPTEYYSTFRLPRVGDIIRISYNTRVICEELIIDVQIGDNLTYIKFRRSLPLTGQNILNKIVVSFYDPTISGDINGNYKDGIYLKFTANKLNKFKKCHFFLKYSKIKNIVYEQ